MDFKKRIIEELNMTDTQAETLYEGYVQVAEKLAKEYCTEQLNLHRVSGSDLLSKAEQFEKEQQFLIDNYIEEEYKDHNKAVLLGIKRIIRLIKRHYR
jgi:hypothetical protein